MAGFFSLGGGGGGGNSHDDDQVPHTHPANAPTHPETWLWFRNPGSADHPLWHHHHNTQQYQQSPNQIAFFQPQQQQRQQQPRLDLYTSAAGLGVGPSAGIDAADEPSLVMMTSRMRGPGGGGVSCQDCGNQAKKDCAHMRCRTCCKSRGFECPTHVKSTWVSAAKRRERQLQQQRSGGGDDDNNIHSNSNNNAGVDFGVPQRQRETSGAIVPAGPSSSLVCTRVLSHSSGLEMGNFPVELTSPAVFRCVRVSSVDDGGQDQYAYQTAVSIGGHVFKGILYDQGPETSGGDQQSSSGGLGGLQPLNLIAPRPTATAASSSTNIGGSSASAFVDPAALTYSSTPLNTVFMPGTQFFPNPRS